ncbi:MAG: hypothetical protein Q8R24_04685 [Legionellaceae bacterium]|nr:hypothetical protein [Legionellaceae bacterium]
MIDRFQPFTIKVIKKDSLSERLSNVKKILFLLHERLRLLQHELSVLENGNFSLVKNPIIESKKQEISSISEEANVIESDIASIEREKTKEYRITSFYDFISLLRRNSIAPEDAFKATSAQNIFLMTASAGEHSEELEELFNNYLGTEQKELIFKTIENDQLTYLLENHYRFGYLLKALAQNEQIKDGLFAIALKNKNIFKEENSGYKHRFPFNYPHYLTESQVEDFLSAHTDEELIAVLIRRPNQIDQAYYVNRFLTLIHNFNYPQMQRIFSVLSVKEQQYLIDTMHDVHNCEQDWKYNLIDGLSEQTAQNLFRLMYQGRSSSIINRYAKSDRLFGFAQLFIRFKNNTNGLFEKIIAELSIEKTLDKTIRNIEDINYCIKNCHHVKSKIGALHLLSKFKLSSIIKNEKNAYQILCAISDSKNIKSIPTDKMNVILRATLLKDNKLKLQNAKCKMQNANFAATQWQSQTSKHDIETLKTALSLLLQDPKTEHSQSKLSTAKNTRALKEYICAEYVAHSPHNHYIAEWQKKHNPAGYQADQQKQKQLETLNQDMRIAIEMINAHPIAFVKNKLENCGILGKTLLLQLKRFEQMNSVFDIAGGVKKGLAISDELYELLKDTSATQDVSILLVQAINDIHSPLSKSLSTNRSLFLDHNKHKTHTTTAINLAMTRKNLEPIQNSAMGKILLAQLRRFEDASKSYLPWNINSQKKLDAIVDAINVLTKQRTIDEHSLIDEIKHKQSSLRVALNQHRFFNGTDDTYTLKQIDSVIKLQNN